MNILRRAHGSMIALYLLLVVAAPATAAATAPEEQAVSDAYVYLLSRALVVRQETTDIKEPGVDYNQIKYNPLGAADFVNPNLDVAYLEAWIAVDENTPVVLEVPNIKDRYYTAQICDEWGEVIVNINERNYPFHPHGKFAFVAPGSNVAVPADAVRIELHSRKAKMLARVELKTDSKGAVALQQQFKLKALGTPSIQPTVSIPSFDNRTLLGVEIFDHAEALVSSALDVIPLAPQLQAQAQAIAEAVKDDKVRAEVDAILREKTIPGFFQFAVTKAGAYQNNWLATLVAGNYGGDYWTRSAANLVGIWANASDEVIYYIATRDSNGEPLNGDDAYLLHFSAADRPDAAVNGYWSVILVNLPDYRVVPNPLNRFNFNSYSSLKTEADGSLKILVSAKPDSSVVADSNWLPAPAGKPFSLTLRNYVPKAVAKNGEWFPPAMQKLQ